MANFYPIKHTFENGLRVIFLPSENKLVTASVFVNVGSANETESQRGLAHLFEHMVFRGSKKFKNIPLEVELLGAEINAVTEVDQTSFYIKGQSKFLFKYLDILSDMLMNPLFDEEALKQEKDVVCCEISDYLSQPQVVAFEQMQKVMWGPDSPWAQPVGGTTDSVEKLTKSDLETFKKQHYTGSNIVVTISGKVQESFAEIISQIGHLFSKLKKTPKNVSVRLPRTIQNSGNFTYIPWEDLEQNMVCMGFPLDIPLWSLNSIGMEMISFALGQGMSSILFSEVREKAGLTYDIGCSTLFSKDNGMLYISASCSRENTLELIKKVQECIETYQNKFLENERIACINATMETNTIALETSSSLAATLIPNFFIDESLLMPHEYAEIVNEFTKQNLKGLFNEIKLPGVIVVVGTLNE